MAENNNSSAESAAQIIIDKVRFSILTERIIRLEYSPEGKFEDRASLVFVDRRQAVPEFNYQIEAGVLCIKSRNYTLKYKISTKRFQAYNLKIELKCFDKQESNLRVNKNLVWKYGLKDTENLKGTCRTLDDTDGESSVELDDGLISRAGWTFWDDSLTPLFTENSWVCERVNNGQQDWYFMAYGFDYKGLMKDFISLSGRIPLIPRFALGYWWSRYWTYSDRELRELILDFKSHNLPLDVLVIDMDWHQTYGLKAKHSKYDEFGERIGWTGYTWNENLFPQPEQFLDWVHKQEIKVALNLHPASGIVSTEKAYDDFLNIYKPEQESQETFAFKIEEEKWKEAFFEAIIKPLEKQGVDFWWLDWQSWQENGKIKGLNNTWWLNHLFFQEKQKQSRGLLFHRWGGLGNHRYQIGFSGDTIISWKSLAFQAYFTSNAANVAYAYWSHDIGGHMGDFVSDELYIRWLQFGAYSPVFRTHAAKNRAIERRIWMYPHLYKQMRQIMLMRRSLIPYIYTEARLSYDEGIAFCRPLYWEYPELDGAYIKDSYFFGRDMIVSPITEALRENTLIAKNIYLPSGKWFDTVRGQLISGAKEIMFYYSLEEIPVFIREGAIIPTMSYQESLYNPLRNLVLNIYPGEYGTCNYYEDDGISEDYRLDFCCFTKIEQRQEEKSIIITIHETQSHKQFTPLEERSYTLNIYNCLLPRQVTVNDHLVNQERLSYDGLDLKFYFQTESLKTDRKSVIIVEFDQEHYISLREMDGVKLFNKRLETQMDVLKNEINRIDAFANPPDLLLFYASMPSRITYKPRSLESELAFFHQNYLSLLETLIDYPGIDIVLIRSIIKSLSVFNNSIIDVDIDIKTNQANTQCKVTLSCKEGVGNIYYTLDGQMVDRNALQYTKAFTLHKTAKITARIISEDKVLSIPSQKSFISDQVESLEYLSPYSNKYTGNGPNSLLDGQFGDANNHEINWLGFEGVDAIIKIKFKRAIKIEEIGINFLEDSSLWIFRARSLSFELSEDGIFFHKVYHRKFKILRSKGNEEPCVIRINQKFRNKKPMLYLRIKAENIQDLPKWHLAYPGKAWLFIDQIVISGK